MKNNSKCQKVNLSECKKGKCTIYGTQYCKDGMPQPGECKTRPCTRACMIYGTDFCIGGVIKEVKDKSFNLDAFTENFDSIKDLNMTDIFKKK